MCVCFIQLIDDPDVVALNVLSEFIESCVWNISQSDVQTVEQTIQTFDFTVEITSIFSVEITIILNQVFLIACPGQPMCSGRGSCVNAVCVCDIGMDFFSHMLSPFDSKTCRFTYVVNDTYVYIFCNDSPV